MYTLNITTRKERTKFETEQHVWQWNTECKNEHFRGNAHGRNEFIRSDNEYVTWLICAPLYLGASTCWSQWPRGKKCGPAVAVLMGLRVRIPPDAWPSVCGECCVLSSRDFCVELMTHSDESCQVWCVWVWSWSLDNEEALAYDGLSS